MTVNAMDVTPAQARDALIAGWKAQNEHGFFQSFMLHGEPGVGKTFITESAARKIGARFFDVRLTTIDKADLVGLPYYDHDRKMTVFYRPENLPEENEQPAVLFLDEITAAEPHLHPTIYGLLQERRIGQYRLPDNVLIVAAGNGVGDGAIAYEMGTALATRLTHMNVMQESESWINDFAIPKGLHPAVIAFIKTRPDLLHTIQESIKNDDLVASTGRGWEAVSNILYTVSDPTLQKIMVAGRVGLATAEEFWIVANDVSATVKVTEMIKTPRAARVSMYPSTLHGLHAMVYGTIGLLNEENLEPCIEIMADLGDLSKLRPDDADLRIVQLAELSTHGFEALMDKANKAGLAINFAKSPAYKVYHKTRVEAGLTQSVIAAA